MDNTTAISEGNELMVILSGRGEYFSLAFSSDDFFVFFHILPHFYGVEKSIPL